MTIEEFINLVKCQKNNDKIKLSLGKLTDTEISTITKQTGFDLTNFERIIDNYAVKHALKEHGNIENEKKRGQIAIKTNDVKSIPKVVENPDSITSVGKNKIGRDLIVSEKELDDVYFYVEEIRSKQLELAMQTMYKRKKPLKK